MKDLGFIVITLMAENTAKETPSVQDLKWWADQYGLTHPVVADADFGVALRFLRADPGFTGSIGLPNLQLLSPGQKVEMVSASVQKQDIEAHLPD